MSSRHAETTQISQSQTDTPTSPKMDSKPLSRPPRVIVSPEAYRASERHTGRDTPKQTGIDTGTEIGHYGDIKQHGNELVATEANANYPKV